jgi:short-subunit dehydrogenase
MIVAITGASAGIGRELAVQLSARGAKLALSARRLEKLEEVNRSLGGNQLIVRADVSRQADCEVFVSKTLEHFGRIDTLVPNAGYGLYKLTHEFEPQEMRRMFETNLFGTTDLIHAAMPAMLEQSPRDGLRGQVMIVSSAAARRATPFIGPYSATKAAQLSIAEALRVELRSQQIAVTSVHPIMTKTEFGDVAEQQSDVKIPRSKRAFHQTVEHVVRRMVKAIERPIPEVWPHRPTRIGILLAAMMPRVTDWTLKGYMKQVEDANRPGETRPPP